MRGVKSGSKSSDKTASEKAVIKDRATPLPSPGSSLKVTLIRWQANTGPMAVLKLGTRVPGAIWAGVVVSLVGQVEGSVNPPLFIRSENRWPELGKRLANAEFS